MIELVRLWYMVLIVGSRGFEPSLAAFCAVDRSMRKVHFHFPVTTVGQPERNHSECSSAPFGFLAEPYPRTRNHGWLHEMPIPKAPKCSHHRAKVL
jgi:hypothetical protein